MYFFTLILKDGETTSTMTFLDAFSVLLLDMNGTFMFGHDRFGPNENYFATYRALGGRRLSREALLSVWNSSLDTLVATYNDPQRFDDFPPLAEVFARYGADVDEIPVLERVFAAHEIGEVPDGHAAFIRRMSHTHRLGVVSNLCSHPDAWLTSCSSAAVLACFEVLVFSSEGRSVKPSPAIFRRALERFAPEDKILFIGDTLERDIIPAKSLGLSTVWVAPEGSTHPAADCVVQSITELVGI